LRRLSVGQHKAIGGLGCRRFRTRAGPQGLHWSLSKITHGDLARPPADRARYRISRGPARAQQLKELDTFGLSWLPALSPNRLPWVLRDSTIPADEWFECITFRLATSVFRVNGVRLGPATRGQRVGDTLLWLRGRLALLDCKAAQNGYKLGVDDERRLLDYARGRYAGHCESDRVSCVTLVSFGFHTFEADPRRFNARRQRFRDIGSDLACIRADDLVDAALRMLSRADDTRIPEAVAWRRILTQGLAQRERLLRYCAIAAGRR
jgi:hypothetical protein